MGRLSEYDDFERAMLTRVRAPKLPNRELIIGQSPAELRREDERAKLEDFYTKLSRLSSETEE